ncbi:PCI domain-containing protein [Botrytis cinerea]
MEQIKALNALEPFLALTKSATSPRAAIDLITRATDAPGTYIFTELLLTPQIQALSTAPPEQARPFSPTLSAAQTLKLRQLSFLTLAQNPTDLTYPKLQSALALSTPRELEDLVISAIYAGLITCTLDPYNQTVLVSSVSPSAIFPTPQSHLCSPLSPPADAQRRHRDEQDWNAHVESLLEPAPPSENPSGPTGILGNIQSLTGRMTRSSGKRVNRLEGQSSDEEMDDVDPMGVQHKDTRSSKKRGFGGLGFGK